MWSALFFVSYFGVHLSFHCRLLHRRKWRRTTKLSRNSTLFRRSECRITSALGRYRQTEPEQTQSVWVQRIY
ncbi:hypothetical protein J2S70_000207 [Trueperella bonasi]|uniref:Secreted protein n=1 Tax=Trueperella bonasi TaxID=312286 RepID=A0ABT9NE08_9ACTO|nr:hypothetical protein [Trueperella bonasi]